MVELSFPVLEILLFTVINGGTRLSWTADSPGLEGGCRDWTTIIGISDGNMYGWLLYSR